MIADRSVAVRLGGLIVAATLAPYVTTLLTMLAASASDPAQNITIVPLAAFLGIPFGFAGAFLFLAAAFVIGELIDDQPWIFPWAGAAAGIAHTAIGLLHRDHEGVLLWLGGFLLADLMALPPWGPNILFLSAATAGLLAGRVFARIAYGTHRN